VIFEILGEISERETIAGGAGIRDLSRLRRVYGRGNWRKKKREAKKYGSQPAVFGLRSCIGMTLMESEGRSSNVNVILIDMNTTPAQRPNFVVCVDNSDYPASLELHKIYRVLSDEDAAEDGDLRVVDESGEDYLYPAKAISVKLHTTLLVFSPVFRVAETVT